MLQEHIARIGCQRGPNSEKTNGALLAQSVCAVQVTLDGVNIKSLQLKWYRAQLGLVSQVNTPDRVKMFLQRPARSLLSLCRKLSVPETALRYLRGFGVTVPLYPSGQEPTLFATSIVENIRHGRPEATIEDVEEAARAANAHSFILNLPSR